MSAPEPTTVSRFYTTLVARFRRISRVNIHSVTPTFPPVVFENRNELMPSDLSRVPTIPLTFQHPFQIQVFNEHCVVLAGVERRHLVLEVEFPVPHSSVEFSYPAALLLPVVTVVFFPGAVPLFTFYPFSVAGRVKTADLSSIRIVDEVQDPKIQPTVCSTLMSLASGLSGASRSTLRQAYHAPVLSFLTMTCFTSVSSGMGR